MNFPSLERQRWLGLKTSRALLGRIASSEIRLGWASFKLVSRLACRYIKSNLEHRLYSFIIYKIKKYVTKNQEHILNLI
jgi:hypothetical protein